MLKKCLAALLCACLLIPGLCCAEGGTEDLLAKVYTVTWNHCDGTEDQTDPSKGAATSLSTVVAGGTIGGFKPTESVVYWKKADGRRS